MARYTIAGDRLQQADFVATFAPDGLIEASGPNAAGDRPRCAGREAIVAGLGDGAIGPWARRRPTRQASCASTSPPARSLLSANAARGRTYWIACTDIGADHAGHDLDDFRRVDDG